MNKELNNKLKKLIKEENYELLDTVIYDLYDIYLKTYLIGLEKYINNLNLSKDKKIIFYIKLLEYKNTNDKRIESFITGVVPVILSKTITENKIEFLNLLKEEKYRQNFSNVFKKYGHFINIDESILPTILSFPEFLNYVLCNKKFKEKLEYYKYDFFKSLPREYGNLIAFYNEPTNMYDENIKKLYKNYFDGLLTIKQQMKIIQVQKQLKDEYDMLDSKKYFKLKPISNLLRQITKDPSYYNKIEYISYKSQIPLINIIKLAKKYDKTKIFDEICSDTFEYNQKNIEKLKFLSVSEKIKDINEIKSLNDVLLSKLQVMERIHKRNVKLSINNGPQATNESKKSQIFSDGVFREIRRINPDGSILIKNAKGMPHATAVKNTYKEIDFKDKDTSAFERAKKAVKYLSTITLIIEGDACIMVSPRKLTQNQFDSLNYLLSKVNKKANINTIVYDAKKKEDTLIFDVDSIFDTISIKNNITKKKGNI